MNKKQSASFIIALLVFGTVAFPGVVSAASVYFSLGEKEIYPGDTFVVDVRVSSPSELINVADGGFSFGNDVLSIREIGTGGSIFSIWAEHPNFSNDTGLVRFVGGIPEGFQGGDGLMMRAVFIAKKEGNTELIFSDGFSMFLSDGKGTKISPETRPLSVSVLGRPAGVEPRDEVQEIVERDTTPPKFLEAVIGREPALFNNQYFVSFLATDDDSGISYYEVKEGDRSFVRAESPYVLLDQSLESAIEIRVFDKSGNTAVITPEKPRVVSPYGRYLIWAFGLLLVLLVALFYWPKIRKKFK